MNSAQITIRGLDPTTKKLLVKKAATMGISMNAFALKVLKSSVGDGAPSERLQTLKDFFDHNKHLSATDVATIDAKIATLNKLSIKKQQHDDTRT